MADEKNARTLEMGEAYIDESGSTSMEPEGAGHHPHAIEEYPDDGSKVRWENDLGGEPGGDEPETIQPGGDEPKELARGPKPVEGDGDGAPL
jgi:hypothetical protein